MEIKTVKAYNKINLLVLIVIFLGNYACALSLNKNNLISDNSGSSKNIGNVSAASTTEAPGNMEASGVIKHTLAIVSVPAFRSKRDITMEKAIANIRHLFPPNVNDEDLQKWLLPLLSKPQNLGGWDDVEDDEFDDDPPAIDLLHGKKPGSIVPYSESENDGAWADEPTSDPIMLHQHRMNKKSNSGLAPEVLLREATAARSRAQPEPLLMRKLLARMLYGRAQRSEYDNNNGGHFYSVGQLLEHSSRINDGVPAISRMVL